MDPQFGFFQKQTQKLVLSPQMRQYLRLLEFASPELQQAVQEELQNNPTLEEKSPDEPGAKELSDIEIEDDRLRDRPQELASTNQNEKLDSLIDYFEGENGPDFSLQDPKERQKTKDFQESLINDSQSLADYLLWQGSFLNFSEESKTIFAQIIGNIDENGFLKITLAELAHQCQISEKKCADVLKLVQDMDPPGVAARDLQEALKIQLERRVAGITDESTESNAIKTQLNLALRIVTDHMSLLEKRDWVYLAKILTSDPGQIRLAAELIAKLEPRPGRAFYPNESLTVIPDATIYLDESTTPPFKIEVHNEYIPELRISHYYRKLFKSSSDKKTREYLKDKIQNAIDFIQAIQMRQSTLREVTQAIAKAQIDFLFKGFSALKPLRLKDIASDLGIHESTISRATHNKYVATPQGVIAYKSFFSTRLESTDGHGDESQKSMLEKIKTLVGSENPNSPLSDQEIVATLNASGIKIARRTVAKYRDLLKILPSHLRRKK